MYEEFVYYLYTIFGFYASIKSKIKTGAVNLLQYISATLKTPLFIYISISAFRQKWHAWGWIFISNFFITPG